MLIKDVTVGTEYAFSTYDRQRTADWVWLPRADRVVVLAIRPGGKVFLADVDDETGEVGRPRRSPELARYLTMPWAEAAPIIKRIKQEQADARARTTDRAATFERDRQRLVEILADLDLPSHCVPGALTRPVYVYGDGNGIANGRLEFTTTALLDLINTVKES
jgi:hypothetical protein